MPHMGMYVIALLLGCSTASSAAQASDGSCAFWCTRDSGGTSHCTHPECSGCSICTSMVSCTPSSTNDLSHQACEPWCKAQHQQEHCSACSCSACAFCGPGAAATTGAAPVAAPKPCQAVARDDGNVEACQGYCTSKHASAHCTRCDCKMCDFCASPSVSILPPSGASSSMAGGGPPTGPACTPTSRDDLSYKACQKWCKPERALPHHRHTTPRAPTAVALACACACACATCCARDHACVGLHARPVCIYRSMPHCMCGALPVCVL